MQLTSLALLLVLAAEASIGETVSSEEASGPAVENSTAVETATIGEVASGVSPAAATPNVTGISANNQPKSFRLIGLFDVLGEECPKSYGNVSSATRQWVAATEWVVGKMKEKMDIDVDLDLLDSCLDSSHSVNVILRAAFAETASRSSLGNCGTEGYLLASSVSSSLFPVLDPVLPLHVITPRAPRHMVRAILSLLRRLHVDRVQVVTDNDVVKKKFHQMAKEDDVCVLDMKTRGGNASLNLDVPIVLLGVSLDDLTTLALGKARTVIATDDQNSTIGNYDNIETIYIIKKAFDEAPEFMSSFRAHTPANEDPTAVGLMQTVVTMASCGLADFTDLVPLVTKPRYLISRNGEHIGEYSDGLLRLDVRPTLYDDPVSCEHCPACLNLDPIRRSSFVPEPSAWITVMLTVACVGILFSLSLIIYLTCKSCTEVVEGSQCFSVLLLLAIIFMYLNLIPFVLSTGDLICAARIHFVQIGFAFLFSVILARSVMLATADADGLPGHISGVGQFALLVFMAGVQVALSVQEFFIREKPYAVVVVRGRYEVAECVEQGKSYLFHLGYVMLLLLLQTLISPCIIRSKRNYREGLLFWLGSLASVTIWIGWVVMYFVLSDRFGSHWRDIAVCCGVVATPSVLLLLIFVPKCYLMSVPSYKRRSDGSPGGELSVVNLQRINQLRLYGDTHHLIGSSGDRQLIDGTTTTCSTTEGTESRNPIYDTLKVGSPLYSNVTSRIPSSSNDSCSCAEEGTSNPAYSSTASPSSASMEAAASYPTFKLDSNTVLDNSMRYESWYPSQQKKSHRYSIPVPPPVPKMETTFVGGTRM